MRFCKECNNMLYASDAKDNQVLRFTCKNCNYSEVIERNSQQTNCVYRNEVKLGQSAVKIDPMIVNDPTFSRTRHVNCPECSYGEAIFFQNPNNDESGMKLIFVCCNKDRGGRYCGRWWFNDK